MYLKSTDVQPDHVKEAYRKQFWGHIPLAVRVTAWFAIFLALMLFLLGLFILQFSHHWEDMEIRNQLQNHTVAFDADHEMVYGSQDGIYAVLTDKDGLTIQGALPDQFPSKLPLTPYHVKEYLTPDRHTFYYYDYPKSENGRVYWVRNIMPLMPLQRKIDILMLSLLLGGLLFLLSGIAGGYLLIKRSLRPLRDITRTSMEIGKNKDLSRRVPQYTECKDEISDLVNTLNAMFNNLERADQRVKQFNSDVSHELRTPIAVMQAESDYGRSCIQSVEEAKKGFQVIFEQCQFMTDVVSQLLAMARIDALQGVAKEQINLSEILWSVIENYETLHKGEHIALRHHVQEGLIIEANRVLLKQAICNLLDNAYKFTKDTIVLRAYRSMDKVFLIIEDNGIGISPEKLPKIWDRLYQIEQSRKRRGAGGVGIGLYFVKNVMQLHHADVFVSSTPHQRTRFTLLFSFMGTDDDACSLTGYEDFTNTFTDWDGGVPSLDDLGISPTKEEGENGRDS